MIRTAALLCLLASTAEAQDSARTNKLIAAIEAAGCVVTEGNEAAILAASGMDEDEAMLIVMELMASGRAVPQDDDLRLVTGGCA